MTDACAYFNGRFLPQNELALPVSDAGFVLGATVTEQLRTFAGRLFRIEAHLDRLSRSLEIVQIEPGLGPDQLADIAGELIDHNHRLLASGDDLGLSIFITPGPYPALAGDQEPRPTVCLHTYPLPFRLWAAGYSQGLALLTTDVEQVSPRSWPPELKCRSRMHYYLADRQAAARRPGARALLRDARGHVTETSTSNIVLYLPDQGLVTPPNARVLPGISLTVLGELADKLGMAWQARDLCVADVAAAREVLLTSTPNCLLPVVEFNGRAVGDGTPGATYRRLLAAWSDLVGLDIAGQARTFADREIVP